LGLGPVPLFSLEFIVVLSSTVFLLSYLEKWDLLILFGEIILIPECRLCDLTGDSLSGFFLGGSSAKIIFLIESLSKIDFFFGPRK